MLLGRTFSSSARDTEAQGARGFSCPIDSPLPARKGALGRRRRYEFAAVLALGRAVSWVADGGLSIGRMRAPGGLTELGKAVDSWATRVAEVLEGAHPPLHLLFADRSNATELRVPDWPAVPARVRACLGRRRADWLMDHHVEGEGDAGRRAFQEEYAEWRIVRDQRGPVRFELTTELADYWELLAVHAPQTAIDLVGEFARERVSYSAVFGEHDPFAATSSEEARATSFLARMLGRDRGGADLGFPGPYNSGTKAITCLWRSDNTLDALLNLVAASATPQLVIDAESKEPRFPSASEAIPRLRPQSAQDCRNSDPVVVERIVRLATEGRLIRFDDPIGIYIVDVQSHELLAPDGEPLPRQWFELSRQGPEMGDGLSRHQRLVLELPTSAGFTLAEVRSRRTGELLTHGAEIAELIQLGVYVRVSERDQIPVSLAPHASVRVPPCRERLSCRAVRDKARELEED